MLPLTHYKIVYTANQAEQRCNLLEIQIEKHKEHPFVEKELRKRLSKYASVLKK
jgi:hypothetical protein